MACQIVLAQNPVFLMLIFFSFGSLKTVKIMLKCVVEPWQYCKEKAWVSG